MKRVKKEQKNLGNDFNAKLRGEFYSVKTAAQLLDCSEEFFRHRIRKREITFVKFGGMVRIPVSEIEKLKKVFSAIDKEYDNLVN